MMYASSLFYLIKYVKQLYLINVIAVYELFSENIYLCKEHARISRPLFKLNCIYIGRILQFDW